MPGMVLHQDASTHDWRTARAGAKVDMDNPTQFKQAMDRLGIHLEPAYSPEARVRSERVFGTLQGRLPKEFAHAEIADVESANAWLVRNFLPRHNRWFAHKARLNGETAFVPLADPSVLDGILCETHERVVGNDNCVSFEGMTLQIPAQPHRPTYRKVRVKVKRHIDGNLSVWHGPKQLSRYAPNGELREGETPQTRTPKGGGTGLRNYANDRTTGVLSNRTFWFTLNRLVRVRRVQQRVQHLLDDAAPKEAPGRGGSAAYELEDNMGDRTMRMFAQGREFYLKLRVDGTEDAEALRRLREL